MTRHPLNYLAPLGRILLAAIFIASGANKIMDRDLPAQMMADKGVQYVPILLSVAVALEILGGVSVLLGFYARLGALMLLAFLIPVSLIMHNFWQLEGQAQMIEMIGFMKNTSIAGGLILVLSFGAGPISIDSFFRPRTRPAPPLSQP